MRRFATVWATRSATVAYAYRSRPSFFGYFYPAHRRRKITPGRHPVPEFVKIVLEISLKLLNRLPVNTRCSLVGLHSPIGLPHLTLRNTKRFCSRWGLLPLPVGPFLKLDGAAPLLRFHYEPSSLVRAAPPRCPASVLSSLWVLHLDFSLIIGATGSHVPHGSL